MVKAANLEKYFVAWDENNIGYFKIAPIKLSVTSNATDLEAAAKETAKEIEAEVSYAWDLGESDSEAWWLEWGGYRLEEEIPYFAAITMPEAEEKLKNFDPKDNEFECDSIEEFKDLLFNAYDEDLKAVDLKRGFKIWLKSLEPSALEILARDLKSWASRAR